MIEKILHFSVTYRYLVALIFAAVAAYGIYALQNLPIDAVPDITNNQVQINTSVVGLSPIEIEKQVTFPIEASLSGIPGLESTRSLSRNGFSQVTAIFQDHVDVYFARQQINERLLEARESMPPGAEPKLGPISTGLSEVYMWSVHYDPEMRAAKAHEGSLGWRADGSYMTPEGQLLKTDVELASYLRTVEDWVIRPQLKGIKGLAGVDAIGGFVKQYHVEPDPNKMIALGISINDLMEALHDNNLNVGAGYIEQGGETFLVKADGRIETPEHISSTIVTTRNGTPISIRDIAEVSIGKELRSGSAKVKTEKRW